MGTDVLDYSALYTVLKAIRGGVKGKNVKNHSSNSLCICTILLIFSDGD